MGGSGKLIYASDLISINSSKSRSISYSVERAKAGEKKTWYFYCTKPSGESIIDVVKVLSSSMTGKAYIWLSRYENGLWVQKYYGAEEKGTISGFPDNLTLNSYGEGAYRLSLQGEGALRKALNVTATIYPCATDIVRGDYLTCCSDSPVDVLHSEYSVMGMVLRARGEYLTQELIDGGALYTTPV